MVVIQMKVEELKGSPFTGMVNVGELLKEPIGNSHSYEVDTLLDDRDPVRGTLTLIHTSRGILVRGRLTVDLELECSRCLRHFPSSVHFSIEEEFLPVWTEAPSFEELANVLITHNNRLDLAEIVRQYALINVPMKPLCRPDCSKEVEPHGSP